LGVALLLVAVLGAVLYAVRPACLAQLGLDVWELPALLEKLREGERTGEKYARELERIAVMERRKQAVVQELIAGRLALAEATWRFHQVDDGSDWVALKEFRYKHPGEGDDVLRCRLVIHWVKLTLCERPEECRAVVARLDAELAGLRTERASGR
jgi:hypothetical protein